MSLFFTHQKLIPIKDYPVSLETPLGKLDFEIKMNHSFVGIPSSTKSSEKTSILMNWNHVKYHLDCLKISFTPILPPAMKVDQCFAYIWRMEALEDLNVNFKCLAKNLLEGSPESGAFLISQSFENQSIKLSIGTEDEEKIQSRAKDKDWVPQRIDTEAEAYSINCLNHGLEVNFSLLMHEKIQIQFIIAWSSRDAKEISTWYAVEQQAMTILKEAGFH